MANRSEVISKRRAVRAALARIPLLGEKRLQANLEFAADSLAHAYQIGVEEAQREIAFRIAKLKPVNR